jgi:hypothetical protein
MSFIETTNIINTFVGIVALLAMFANQFILENILFTVMCVHVFTAIFHIAIAIAKGEAFFGKKELPENTPYFIDEYGQPMLIPTVVPEPDGFWWNIYTKYIMEFILHLIVSPFMTVITISDVIKHSSLTQTIVEMREEIEKKDRMINDMNGNIRYRGVQHDWFNGQIAELSKEIEKKDKMIKDMEAALNYRKARPTRFSK